MTEEKEGAKVVQMNPKRGEVGKVETASEEVAHVDPTPKEEPIKSERQVSPAEIVTQEVEKMNKALINRLGKETGLFVVVDVAGIGTTMAGNAPEPIAIGILETAKFDILSRGREQMQREAMERQMANAQHKPPVVH